jgi:hypothetical protein
MLSVMRQSLHVWRNLKLGDAKKRVAPTNRRARWTTPFGVCDVHTPWCASGQIQLEYRHAGLMAKNFRTPENFSTAGVVVVCVRDDDRCNRLVG